MADILTTSVSGLLAFQRALATTGHNIANANTDGYSRQRVEFTARPPQGFGNGFIGSGTQVRTVQRAFDAFIAGEVLIAGTAHSRLDSFHNLATRMDNMLADPTAGLTPSLQGFFNALQDVADDPSSIPAREALLGQAESLAARFHSLDQGFVQLDKEVNARITESVANINSLADAIAELNKEIVRLQGAVGQPPNDLLDRRDLLIRQLSEDVEVSTLVQDDGSMNVFIGSGQTLVIGGEVNRLETAPNEFEPTRLEVVYAGTSGSTIVTDSLNGGTIGGVIDFRREMLEPARNALGRVAVAVADSFNTQHREGMNLDGQLGADFFAVGAPSALPSASNTGTAAISVSVQDISALTTADYELSFDGAAYTLTRAGSSIAIPMSGSGSAADPFVAEGLSIVVGAGAAAGDSFLLRPTRPAASGFAALLNDPDAIAAAAPVRAQAATANLGDGTISAGEVIDVNDPGLLSPATIQFIDPNTYSINGAGAFAYTPGADIDINGVRVQIEGSPLAGDTFTIAANTGGVGDNRNALLLGGLQSASILDGGTASFQDGYGRLVAQVGTTTQQTGINLQAQSAVLANAQLSYESVSGVNLDEEAANLLRYQQSYQAMAQMVGVVDSLFQTLLGAFSR